MAWWQLEQDKNLLVCLFFFSSLLQHAPLSNSDVAQAKLRAHSESWACGRVEIILNLYWSGWLNILSHLTSPYSLGVSVGKVNQCFCSLLIPKSRRLKNPEEKRVWCIGAQHWMREFHRSSPNFSARATSLPTENNSTQISPWESWKGH